MREGRRPALDLLKVSVLLAVCLRVIYSATGALCALYLHPDPALIKLNALTEQLSPPSRSFSYLLVDVWERFDTLWYLHLAQSGYDRAASVVFYPLYPLLIRVFSTLFGNPLLAALLISSVAAVFLFWGFQKLLRLDLPPSLVSRSLLLLAAWPPSFVFFAGYPESLMLASILWSVYFARVGKWWRATGLAILSALSKAAGALVLIPLAVIAWKERGRRPYPLLLAPLGAFLFPLYLRVAGLGQAPEAYSKYWRTDLAFPWETLHESFVAAMSSGTIILWASLTVLVLFLFLTVCCRLRLEYVLYGLGAIALFLARRNLVHLQSCLRYALGVFPAYVAAARLLRGWRTTITVAMLLFAANLVLLLTFFAWSVVV